MNIEYSKKVLELFRNPKNMGEMKNPDAVGQVGNPQCLLPEEKIFLDDEFKKISIANNKNYVISHNSAKNKIINKFIRDYNGKIILLQNNLGKISLTPEHLIYALKLPKHNNYFRTKNKKELIPAWYHAEQLEKRDIILYPIPKEIKDIKFIEIDIPKLKYDFRSKKLPNKIPLNADILRLFGYFLSEGNVQDKPCKTYISFSLNLNEKEIANDINNISHRLFGLNIKIKERIKENGLIVYIYNAQLARFFKTLFGNGAEHKKIPEFIMALPLEKQKALISGLWKGDGYVNVKRINPRAGYSTISYQLVQQVKFLLLRQKIISSAYVEEAKKVKGVNHKKSYRIHVGQRDSLKKLCQILGLTYIPKSYESVSSWFDNNFLYNPITKIIKKDYNGKVYNLEIENTHSFISEAFILHNCGDIMKIYLKIGKNKSKKNYIKDIKFQTMGCVAAIATSSMATQLTKGKTLEEAKKITNKKVAESLKGLPPEKLHCSNLAADAIRKAIKNYEEKTEI